MKKIYILALTFFAVLCGELSYGQLLNQGESYNDLYNSLSEGTYTNIDGIWFSQESVIVYGYYSSNFNWSANDFAVANNAFIAFECNYCSPLIVVGGSGYTPPFEDGGPCLIKECSNGRMLDASTCKCVEPLPPCFGTTVEGLIPDGTADENRLVEALQTTVNSFFKSSDVLDTMKWVGILDSEELSKGFDKYIEGGNILGKISLAFVANDYLNNPTTENLMKIFVEGALLALPPPASVGYTALDALYQKYFDGKPFADILAQKMAETTAELFDCDLGSGVYGVFHYSK
jgi:hypothetical protein